MVNIDKISKIQPITKLGNSPSMDSGVILQIPQKLIALPKDSVISGHVVSHNANGDLLIDTHLGKIALSFNQQNLPSGTNVKIFTNEVNNELVLHLDFDQTNDLDRKNINSNTNYSKFRFPANSIVLDNITQSDYPNQNKNSIIQFTDDIIVDNGKLSSKLDLITLTVISKSFANSSDQINHNNLFKKEQANINQHKTNAQIKDSNFNSSIQNNTAINDKGVAKLDNLISSNTGNIREMLVNLNSLEPGAKLSVSLIGINTRRINDSAQPQSDFNVTSAKSTQNTQNTQNNTTSPRINLNIDDKLEKLSSEFSKQIDTEGIVIKEGKLYIKAEVYSHNLQYNEILLKSVIGNFIFYDSNHYVKSSENDIIKYFLLEIVSLAEPETTPNTSVINEFKLSSNNSLNLLNKIILFDNIIKQLPILESDSSHKLSYKDHLTFLNLIPHLGKIKDFTPNDNGINLDWVGKLSFLFNTIKNSATLNNNNTVGNSFEKEAPNNNLTSLKLLEQQFWSTLKDVSDITTNTKWQLYLLPVNDGIKYNEIKFFIKNEDNDDNNDAEKNLLSRYNKRFIIEIIPENIGKLWLDCLYSCKEDKSKNFNIIVKSVNQLDHEIKEGIEFTFEKVRSTLDLVGKIDFYQVNKNFVDPLAEVFKEVHG